MYILSYLTLLLDLPPSSHIGFEDLIGIQEQLRVLHNSSHLNGISDQSAHPTRVAWPNRGPGDSRWR